MSIPFTAQEFNFTQPDGTALRVRGWGDQYQATFEALNGFTIVEDPVTGFWQYADVTPDGDDLIATGARPRMGLSAGLTLKRGLRISKEAAKAKAREHAGMPPGTSRWEKRREQHKQMLRSSVELPGLAGAPPTRQTVGSFVGLCLLIQFPDVPGTITRDQVDDFCNKVGYDGFGNNGSVYDYFLEVSVGRLRYKSIVAPYYTARHPRSYYTNESVEQPKRARELIKEALDFHRANGFDFSTLTVDEQQYVYATNVFYAGTRVNNWSKGLWPHSYHLQTPYKLAAGRMAFDYQITDMTDELSLGTFCHENGHMVCDFPDLYDYGYESAGVGTFCLMCAGPNADKKNPPHVNAYLKYKAGWASSMTRITAGLSGTAVAGSNAFFFHRKGQTEYYIIENRHRSGRDMALPGSGLAIWRVDELGDNQYEQMTPTQHYECSLVQADGRNDLENDRYNPGDAGDLFRKGGNERFAPTTRPNSSWWDGSASGLEIGAIGAEGPQIKFTAKA